jgi:hypothetical protein
MLRCEQGLGDAIQFARYVPVLAAKGSRVYLSGPSRLTRLFAGLQGLAAYVPDGAAMPDADFHAPLLSVPHLLKCEAIPNEIPYLAADPARIVEWAVRLGSNGRRRIGLAWQGNPSYDMDYLRSIPTSFIPDLISGVDARFLILQRGEIAPEILAAGAESPGPDLDRDHAFFDTAAIMANLDLVITSDTALAHLAGALGCQTLLLLSSAPDWRWRLGRSDCEWYPSLRLIRQPRPGDWIGAIEEAQAALTAG